jgi:integrase
MFPAENRHLFGPDALQTRWQGVRPPFAAALLGIAAGLRIRDVHEDFVTVTASWEELHGRKGAKWNSERLVPIPTRVAEELEAVMMTSLYQEADDLVFPGHRKSGLLEKRRAARIRKRL